MEKKKKGPVFSEEIDSIINGLALGLCFIGTGTFLLIKPTYFHIPIISYIVGAILGSFGVLGTGMELSKLTRVKGTSSFVIGIVFFAIWLFFYIKLNTWWMNLISFAFLFIGGYAFLQGLFQSIFSIIQYARTAKSNVQGGVQKRKGETISQIVLFLTQLSALAIGIINALKAADVF